MEIRGTDSITGLTAAQRGSFQQPVPQMTQDSAEISDAQKSGSFDLSRIAAIFKRPDAPELRAKIEDLYAKVIDDKTPDEKRSDIWAEIVEKSGEYLKMEGGFNSDCTMPLSRYSTSDPDVQFVTLSAPRPYLAGTMASNWNFIQWKDEKGVHAQSLGEDDCSWNTEGKVWKEGDTTYLTALGLSKASTRDMGAYVKVYEKKDDGWAASKNRFQSPVAELEGHELYLSDEGSFSVANDMTTDSVLEFSFAGNHNDILIKGENENHLTLQDGVYHLHPGKTKQERHQEEVKKELEDSIERLKTGNTEAGIEIEKNKVNIGGVTLPIK